MYRRAAMAKRWASRICDAGPKIEPGRARCPRVHHEAAIATRHERAMGVPEDDDVLGVACEQFGWRRNADLVSVCDAETESIHLVHYGILQSGSTRGIGVSIDRDDRRDQRQLIEYVVVADVASV